MSNPFQHSSPSFNGDFSLSGLPTPINQRRTSYANIVSGTTALTRPPPAGAFSHLLNPSPDSDMQSSLYGPARRSRPDTTFTQARNGTPGEEGTPTMWPPRLGAGLPWFSHAFDLYMAKEPLLLGGTSDDGFGNQLPSISSTGFLSPSYLRGSVYLQRLEEAHKAKVVAEREGHAAKAQTGTGLVTGGNAHLPNSKLPSGSHRGVAYELIEKLPVTEDDETVSPLPSRWNKDDKDVALEVLGDGYEVKYTGRNSSDHEACAIRADHHMPSQCGVYYFEILILNRKKEDTTIGIGFSSRSVALTRPPGWEPESWGYHGDDGNSFAAQNVGKPYGPKFGPGDTVGCLLNFREGTALFTKDGNDLGIAFRDVNFKDVKGKLYPTVGLKKPGDHVLVNFGQRPFMFDIDGYMKKMISENIKSADTSKLAPSLNETEFIQQLVLQFLQHDGYVETARAFAEEIHAEKQALSLDPDDHIPGINIADDQEANNRQSIRRAILEGDIDQALEYTNKHYPTVLADNEQVYFRLRCRKFIEMIRKEAELNLLLEKRGAKQQQLRYHNVSLGLNSGHHEDDEEMFEGNGNAISNGHNNNNQSFQSENLWGDEAMMDDATTTTTEEDGSDLALGVLSKLSQEALAYGIELRTEFAADPRREVSKHLEEIFALIAYPNPLKVKEVAHLLDRAGRGVVAEELNSVILMSLGKSSRAALENLYAQTCVLLEDLRVDGGDGAFVTVQSVIDDIPKPSLV
ncbi:hypothetical protein B0H66DRAFT_129849 [Apodospora peruviana]|uniref:Protein SSH4 n=1 Tax=Apodospora peruviana TaxID=516989 RepID=A0AAE0IIJ7_9PEZI|nr:hypothetical protein B0H66DRAFT_129849 [Apodospora peruviana]